MYSRKAKYGLIAVVSIAAGDWKTPRLIEDIAREEQLPHKFLEAILLDLREVGILGSKKGRGGGYFLARPPEEITVAEVFKAIDGSPIPFRCVAIRADKTCEECIASHLCAIGPLMREADKALFNILGHKSIKAVALAKQELAAKAEGAGPMFYI